MSIKTNPDSFRTIGSFQTQKLFTHNGKGDGSIICSAETLHIVKGNVNGVMHCETSEGKFISLPMKGEKMAVSIR